MKIALCSILLILLVNCSICNGQSIGITNHWLMGYASWGGAPFGHSQFDFSNGTLSISTDSLEMDFRQDYANISDDQGNLLFYTNGYYIADATNDTMQNGSGINPGAYTNYASDGLGIPQATLILKNPGNNSIYRLFHGTLDDWPNPNSVLSFELYESTIDMNLNNGLGSVISKNTIVINDTLIPGKIVACKHANGRDWWIVCLKAYSNEVYKLLLTPSGIQSITTQNIGSYRTFFYGQAKFSPDGTKFAVFTANYTMPGYLEVFDFDRCTGNFTLPQLMNIPQSNGSGGGIEFSPNSEFLYTANVDSVYQYNLTSTNVDSTKTIVAAYDSFADPNPPFGTYFFIMQLAPDGKIYISTGNGTRYLHVINYPDSLGLACNLVQHGIQIQRYYFNTLPNHPNYFLGADTNSICDSLSGVGLNEQLIKIKIEVSPNPSSGIFSFHFPVNENSTEIEIYDVLGKLLRIENIAPWSQYKTCDLSNLTSGIYLCQIKLKDRIIGQVKILKE